MLCTAVCAGRGDRFAGGSKRRTDPLHEIIKFNIRKGYRDERGDNGLKESKVYKELGALTKEKDRWENSITYRNDSHERLARHADSENECWIEL